jgi:hypothetical protein
VIRESDELALAIKLKALGMKPAAFEGGLTTVEQRRDIVRTQIRTVGAEVTYTLRDGKRITLADQFHRAYGEAL